MKSSLSYIIVACSILNRVYASSIDNDLGFAFPSTSTPVPFKISVNPTLIKQSIDKVKLYRPSRDIIPEWTNEGPARTNITQLATYWATNYDWHNIEKQMNTNLSHFATTVPGSRDYKKPIPLHFVHERSSDANAIPLLLLHGWPSSHLEYSKVIAPLAEHKNVSFHVVAPDLPGFGFSPAPTQPGMGAREMGDAFNKLMKQLGYKKYGVVSTDLGWMIAGWMCKDVSSNVIGHFTSSYFVTPNATDIERFTKGQTTPEETEYMIGANSYSTSHSAYSMAHTQKPLALALAFADSPVGYAGWIWDLIYSDGYTWSAKDLITTTMMLWIQGPYANLHSYLEFAKVGFSVPQNKVPTGVTQWARPDAPDPSLVNYPVPPRSWVERTANVVYFARHDFGGHFPAILYPEVWLQDVRNFFLR